MLERYFPSSYCHRLQTLLAGSSSIADTYEDPGDPPVWLASCACEEHLGYIQNSDKIKSSDLPMLATLLIKTPSIMARVSMVKC